MSNARKAKARTDLPTTDGVEDFDAYWQSHGKTGTPIKVLGETVHLPTDIPLRFQLEAERLQDSEDIDDIKHLCSVLLPEDGDVLDRWLTKGMGVEQLGVFLIYATRKIGGQPVTFAEAHEQYRQQIAAKGEGEGTANPT